MSAPETMVLADVVASWPLKLTYIDTRWSLPANARYPLTLDSDDVCNLLRRCTRLRSVTLFATEEVAAVLAAMTTPAHRLQKLHLAYEGTLTLDWATLLQPWLSSGHARHVSFNKAPAADMAGLARALATTSSLRSLAILENDALIRAFLALRMPLHQLTKLHLSTHRSKLLRQFLKLCALASLTSFALDCYASFATVTLFVSHMPALRHLSLGFCFFGADADDASRWPHLESIEFCDVDFGSGARDAVLAYLARVQGLQKMSFDHCYTLCRPFVGLSRTLVRLINDGLTLASFESTALDDVDASHLALVLRRSRNLLPFTLNVMGDDFTMVGIRTLLLALATCASVCIKIDISPYCFEEEIEAFLAAHGMSSVLENASSYALYSPSRVLEA
ncbi:hypothetical protein SDRG_08060 [Saprolegnia diclina VS20]|uniref:F-box domain-containing protein n=1 Tax=Saprolegnia diclina (strain VS20) TaxID=1156394 RepID=T0RV65_SAPDV|nr:hypothetical protein SDRG_08060 [Saprolegnia diclina VS20]EQC34287.1 hypothetical protein SDRG_08060 [Saprolegnia diclina VS20]|eukprot:XP_008612149.1 hypothetical protein SDRG_08060 [Saprolegnia diclina VS20]